MQTCDRCDERGLLFDVVRVRLIAVASLPVATGSRAHRLQWFGPRDRGAWWAAVYGVTQSQTRLK